MSNTLHNALAEVGGSPSRLSLGRSIPHDKVQNHRYDVFISDGMYAIMEDGAFLVDLFTTINPKGIFRRWDSISNDTRIPISDPTAYLSGFEKAYSFNDRLVYRDHSFHEIVERVATRTPLLV